MSVKVCLYSRVSTLLGQDPEIQLINLRQVANARGFTVVEEFVDLGISGAKERRPALDKLIADARKGRFNVVMVAALDRISRDTRHLLNLVHELNHYDVSLFSLRENLDFSGPVGSAFLTITGAISALERDLCRERIRNALAAKKLAAERSGSSWRCGRPVKVTQVVEAQARLLRGQGLSIRQVASELGLSKTAVQRLLTVPKPVSNLVAEAVEMSRDENATN